jgi:hypothetical protein
MVIAVREDCLAEGRKEWLGQWLRDEREELN